jgi:hypothetical protein
MADYGVPSSVPAFTEAAADTPVLQAKETDVTETQIVLRPAGPGGFKPG